MTGDVLQDTRRRLERSIAASSSVPARIRDTVDSDTPDSHAKARTKSSALRLEVPVV